MFKRWRRSAALFISDKVKAAVIRTCLYECQRNYSYAEIAPYHNSVVLLSRPCRPRGEGKVDACVLIVERWLFGRLRHRVFLQPCRP